MQRGRKMKSEGSLEEGYIYRERETNRERARQRERERESQPGIA